MPTKGKRKTAASNRVRLEDIARYCGVSKATVSRVLNDHLDDFPVSEATITRVKSAGEQLGYRPNRLARAIRNQRTSLIGLSFIHMDTDELTEEQVIYENLIMGKFTNSIFCHPDFIKRGYDLVIHPRTEAADRPFYEADFKPDLLDGMIYLTPSTKHREFLDIASREFPIILIGNIEGASEKIPCVDINNRKMARMAVEHLIQVGRKKILILVDENLGQLACMQDRMDGYREALESNGIPVSGEFIRTARGTSRDVKKFFSELRCLDEIDAIFCPNDPIAALCINPLKEMGKRIPEDIALMGFSDRLIARHTTPTLSTVRLPAEKMVFTAIDMLLKILNSEIPYEPGFTEIDTELLIRDSTPRLA